VVRAVLIGLAVCLSTAAAGQTRKPSGDEWEQVRPLFKLVEETASGKAAPADVTMKWHCHFIDAEAGVVFVPFTLTIERGEFSAFPLAMYVRVVARGAPAPAPGPRDALAQYPFEDAAIVRPTEEVRGGRITRAFAAPPGEYDVYVALREHAGEATAEPKTVVVKQAVSVPDLKSGLAVSSIIVADRIQVDPRAGRLNFEEQLDEPYVWWGTRITPAVRDAFARSEKLAVTFVIYNAAAAAGDKPDVEVQYNFFRRTDTAEEFFTSTKPELFNAKTLPQTFSLAGGDLLIAGQQIPLAPFAQGAYRLGIVVTDKTNGKSITRDVYFTVTEP
jgi:hypothetical protein